MGSAFPPPKTLITPALFSRPPPRPPGEEGEVSLKGSAPLGASSDLAAPRVGAGLDGRLGARPALVEGTGSILRLTTDILGSIVLTEEDPDLSTTAYGVISDLFRLQEERAGSAPALPARLREKRARG